MPLYDYQCLDCNKHFEVFCKVSDTADIKCAACGSLQVKKAVSAPSFQLKGGGWYKDGYASVQKSGSSSPQPTSEAKNQDSKSSETKSSS
ncbi:MAG TPA: zinc ribbon domain-containing protein [Oligoflexia bacterium]|nr:zinc ribbon domain-containing protein [Oligoflexia bacterium]HMR25711.1 zinc ribbon domain-containing protein [Oligoflexia bacterium]